MGPLILYYPSCRLQGGRKDMLSYMNKFGIIQARLEGKSYRQISKELSIDRKTVKRYWEEYCLSRTEYFEDSSDSSLDKDQLLLKMIEAPKYDSSNRSKRKYTSDIDKLVSEILEAEAEKDKLLGTNHKQSLTNKGIHELVIEAGHDISYRSLCEYIRVKRLKAKEAFIRQSYPLGQRVEYDFGEIRLQVEGQVKTYFLAVFSCPASGFRWAYLYTNQKKEVFLNSHVEFFDMVGGVYQEVVYDNMRNVVKEFIGKSQKVINEDLIRLSTYYKYRVITTNCFSGNEKGHVERSVEIIRKEAFSKKYTFRNIEEARSHLSDCLMELNQKSIIHEEKKHLSPALPRFELAQYQIASVDKYSCISFQGNHYSVPEYLVGRKVSMKIYHEELMIYANQAFVCAHKKEDGKGKYILKLEHYLDTFIKKPGAIRNSQVLQSYPVLHNIFQQYFISKPKEFIELIRDNPNVSIEQLVEIIHRVISTGVPITTEKYHHAVEEKTRSQMHQINQLYNLKGGKDYVH